jgi:hypothetical protein
MALNELAAAVRGTAPRTSRISTNVTAVPVREN